MQEKVCVKVKIFIFPCSGRPEEWLVGLLITTFPECPPDLSLEWPNGKPWDTKCIQMFEIAWILWWLLWSWLADLTFTHWVLGLRNRCGPLFSLLPSLFKDPCTGCIQDTKNMDKATGKMMQPPKRPRSYCLLLQYRSYRLLHFDSLAQAHCNNGSSGLDWIRAMVCNMYSKYPSVSRRGRVQGFPRKSMSYCDGYWNIHCRHSEGRQITQAWDHLQEWSVWPSRSNEWKLV